MTDAQMLQNLLAVEETMVVYSRLTGGFRLPELKDVIAELRRRIELETSQPNRMGTTPAQEELYMRFDGEDIEDANRKDAEEFCKGAFGPFVTDVSQYVDIVAELLKQATERALAATPAVGGEVLRSALAALVEINRRDELTDPCLAASDTWRAMAWENAAAALAQPASPLRGREETEDEDWNIRKYIDFLRAGEGDSVTVLCDNPEGPANNAVECNGYWTNWKDRRFEGETLLVALSIAYLECTQYRAALAHGRASA